MNLAFIAQVPKTGFIVLGVFVALFGSMIFIVVRMLKKTAGGGMQSTENSSSTVVATSQDFVPFATVEHDIMKLGGFEYRVVLEVSSVNYHFRNEDEQDVLENSYSTLLNMIQYPFSLFVQTREIDMNEISENLKKNIQQTLTAFPGLRDYGENYYNYIVNLKTQTGCTKQKKKYIILSCNEGKSLNGASEQERKNVTESTIRERAELVKSSLQSVGLYARMLTTNEIVELFYSLTHREDANIVDGIREGQYTSDIVTGPKKDPLTTLDDAIRILQECENKFTLEVMTSELTEGQAATLRGISDMVFNQTKRLQEMKKNGGMDALKSLEEQFSDAVAEEGM